MVDFSHLKELDVSAEKTAEYILHQITVNGKTPVLLVRPATDANKPYFNALLKRAGKSARQIKAGRINAGMVEENREEDKDLYPKHVVSGWKDVLDATGVEAKFNEEDCAKFLAALPNWLFDELRNFCGDPQNFTDILDVEVSAKN